MEENENKKRKVMDLIMDEGIEGILPDRMEEMIRRLYVIHELRWQLGSMYPGTDDEDNVKYHEANEFLCEVEKQAWQYGRGEREEL